MDILIALSLFLEKFLNIIKSKIYNTAHIFLIAMACGALLARYISPASFGFFQYLPFFLFPITILFLIITIMGYRKKTFLYYFDSILLIVLLLDLGNNFQWNSTGAERKTFKIVNYNVAGYAKHPENVAKIVALIKEQEPDIVCFQEYGYYGITLGKKDTISAFCSGVLDLPYYKFFRQRDNDYGLIVFSRYKFIKADTLFMTEDLMNGGAYCEFEVEGKRLGVLNFHLYSYALNTRFDWPPPSLIGGARQLNSILKKAYKEQENELKTLIAKAQSLNFPVVLAGDLNNIPDSYFYNQMTASFHDSFMEKGRGRGITYPLIGIGLRIDYQFSKNLTVVEHTVLKNNLSDHYALSVGYTW